MPLKVFLKDENLMEQTNGKTRVEKYTHDIHNKVYQKGERNVFSNRSWKKFLIPEAYIIDFIKEDIITTSDETDVGDPVDDTSIWDV